MDGGERRPPSIPTRHHTQRYRADVEEDLNNLFNKKFQFRYNAEWKLPNADALFASSPWKVEELERLKDQLNMHKSQLNNFEIEKWSGHTRRRNPAGDVCWRLKTRVNPEFLTQAWTKFYECAWSYNIIPYDALVDNDMVSLHLCEAPGAFIAALNHYLKLNHPEITWTWRANTLNPYHENNTTSDMISDDRFMLHTLEKWDFGEDNSGNLMNWKNSEVIVKNATEMGKVMLVTGDGSIDCVQKPEYQEEATSPLHYCELVTALLALCEGGTLLFKLFTTFSYSTVSLLYLLNQVFEEVHIYKPVTSRQGNSEVYAIGLYYKGKTMLEPYLEKLKLAFGTKLYEETAMFALEDIPSSFLEQVVECAGYFSTLQCQVINANLQAFLSRDNVVLNGSVRRIRSCVAEAYVREYRLYRLHTQHEILKGLLREEDRVRTSPRYHKGSYTQRQLYDNMSLKGKCKSLTLYLHEDKEDENAATLYISEPIKRTFYNDREDLIVSLTFGLPVEKVNSSKFVYVPIFKLYQKIIAEDEFMTIIRSELKDEKLYDDDVADAKKLFFAELGKNEKYNDYEKRCFLTLMKSLRTMDLGESLVIGNFNLLTHFNVSILLILVKKSFEEITFTTKNSIVLHNMISKEGVKMLEDVEKEVITQRDDGFALLNVLPVKETNIGFFFTSILLYNNTFCQGRCETYLKTIAEALRESDL